MAQRKQRERARGTTSGVKTAGFSMLELLVVVGIVLAVGAISIPIIVPAMQDAKVGEGYNTVLETIRQAREAAVTQRRVYIVTLTQPRSIGVAPLHADPLALTLNLSLPGVVAFYADSGLPNTSTTTPDNLGIGPASGAIDFDVGLPTAGASTIYFYPDGSSRDVDGNMNSGVVYIAQPGKLASSRAITVWGATGRIRGWRLSGKTGSFYWRKQ